MLKCTIALKISSYGLCLLKNLLAVYGHICQIFTKNRNSKKKNIIFKQRKSNINI